MIIIIIIITIIIINDHNHQSLLQTVTPTCTPYRLAESRHTLLRARTVSGDNLYDFRILLTMFKAVQSRCGSKCFVNERMNE